MTKFILLFAIQSDGTAADDELKQTDKHTIEFQIINLKL